MINLKSVELTKRNGVSSVYLRIWSRETSRPRGQQPSKINYEISKSLRFQVRVTDLKISCFKIAIRFQDNKLKPAYMGY